MRAIVGYGNILRGEDGFGVEVLRALADKKLENTKLIEVFGLTPELVLELLEVDEILFVDAAYSLENHYALASPLHPNGGTTLSHHISPELIIKTLQVLYQKETRYELFSMLTSHFDTIENKDIYRQRIKLLSNYLGLN